MKNHVDPSSLRKWNVSNVHSVEVITGDELTQKWNDRIYAFRRPAIPASGLCYSMSMEARNLGGIKVVLVEDPPPVLETNT